jgi:hypothetical protein
VWCAQKSLERVVSQYEKVLDEAQEVAEDRRLRADAERMRRLLTRKEELKDDWFRYVCAGNGLHRLRCVCLG